MKLSIGLNLLFLVERSGGAGTYARELMDSMFRLEPGIRITAFVSREAPEWTYQTEGWVGEVDWIRLPVDVTHGPPYNFVKTMTSQWGYMPYKARRNKLDLIHGLANVAPLVSPGVVSVATVLDLIWLRWPQTLPKKETIGMKMVTRPTARFADRLISISQSGKDDLVESFGVPPEKIDVTYLGFRPDSAKAMPTPEKQLREQFGLGKGPLVLCVAQKRQHKNLIGLVQAMGKIQHPDARLILPGGSTPHEEELKIVAAENGDRVVFCDWLSSEDLEGLYRMATCFVLPSFEEGFGLPILEAMARSTAIACSKTTSLPEVAGEAALLFDPYDPQSIADSIDALIGDGKLRKRLVALGNARAKDFTWEVTARKTLETYERAITGKS